MGAGGSQLDKILGKSRHTTSSTMHPCSCFEALDRHPQDGRIHHLFQQLRKYINVAHNH